MQYQWVVTGRCLHVHYAAVPSMSDLPLLCMLRPVRRARATKHLPNQAFQATVNADERVFSMIGALSGPTSNLHGHFPQSLLPRGLLP